MRQYQTQITQYFRQSLIDADRLCPDDKDILPVLGPDKQQDPKATYLALHDSVWQQGAIDPNLAVQIINARQKKGKKPIQQLEIVIFPRVDHLRFQGGSQDKRKRTVLMPLVVFANLDRNGVLRPTNKAPWIPRVWIGPTQSATQPFTEMPLLDEFFTQHPFEGIENWSQLTSYCSRLLCHATGTSYREADQAMPGTWLDEIAIDEAYEMSNQCLLQLDTPVVGASFNLLKVLNFILDNKTFPNLYRAYNQRKNARLTPFSDQQYAPKLAKRHVGQMSGEFPLSAKQRNALHYFIEQKEGEILAVNGPPGTGKTTLIRSVVANLWTQAALDEKEPPFIVATSNNNQAVTNILESFGRIDETGLEESLKGRWLPELDSYGLYFCASGKANHSNPYRYSGPKGEGCMQVWQTQEFVTQASEYFLSQCSRWYGKPCTDIDQALQCLHREMKAIEHKMKQGFELLAQWQQALGVIKQMYGSESDLTEQLNVLAEQIREKTQQYNKEQSLLDAVYALWESRPWWMNLLMWFPPVRDKAWRKTRRLLNQSGRRLKDKSDQAVEASIQGNLDDIDKKIKYLKKTHLSAEQCLQEFRQYQEKLTQWLQPIESLKLSSQSFSDQVAEVNDRYFRFHLFKLATHYFEARWLKETKLFVESHDEDKKSPVKMRRKLHRYAKLTPCFVSTFYMVPGTFMAGEFKDNVWMDLPLLEEIDLLIVDEAGQALPDVSATAFALAKKALIVGDTDQIQPVWSIPASVDRSNLALFDLLGDEQDYESWLDSGLLASSGNVMRLSQRQCRFHQFEQLPRGLYLTEHRRCLNSIIDYCNDLIYQGVLEPLRGKASHVVPWGTMAFQPVRSASRSYGCSRGNPGEATAIAQWLLSQYSVILNYAREHNEKYRQLSDAEVLSKTVGIVTPFSQQAKLIRAELGKAGIKGLTVGTVHSLQGDERLIVLFSSVYGENDKDSGKFYDMGPNMLNVAVSRAKDAFIVFGDPDVFGVTVPGSPSGILRQRLELLKTGQPEVTPEPAF
ncbi:AAA domain-containing protein [Vibrio salinus]|uniref:AAA domain-containing protein n=1 Tax=Vibrio salinus TaxID=2899784 RepID=UPI001E4749F4|nr:AAA domain-containing protein [Vibrio salinus]MCE0495940.1 AAA domain-containing protein [Vibrio salinus]